MRFVFFIIICLTLPLGGFAQEAAKANPNTDPPLLTEVIIGIPNLKAEQFNSVKTALKSINGVTWAGYCEDQLCILLLVNRALVDNDKPLTDAILEVNPRFLLYYKTCSFSLLLNNCRDKEKALSR